MNKLEDVLKQASELVDRADDLKALEDVRVHFLGKKGELTEILKGLGKLPHEERKALGQKVNQVKAELIALIEERLALISKRELEAKLKAQSVDVTLPGRRSSMGSLHPVTQVRQRLEDIFISLGFEVAHGPQVEDEFHNFEALNTPESHPARAMHDTFYFGEGSLLRSHTSTVQIQYMEKNEPPVRIIAPGRVYRRDFDMTHTPMFHQLEGLLVDTDVTFGDLKGLLTDFLHRFFERDMPVRFRPSYFPFTEPSAEVDMGCCVCDGKGCRTCGQSGWIEILGCGMVHPNVLKAVQIDPEKYSGFAFGLGIDRLAMLYFKINDLRALFENDLRFLRQF